MERGSKEEVLAVWHFYPEAQIREVLLGAPSLAPQTIQFFANQFDVAAEAFRSHKKAQNWAS